MFARPSEMWVVVISLLGYATVIGLMLIATTA